MAGIRIGEAYYADSEDAMVDCTCGHRVRCNQVEEVWTDGKVTDICDACVDGPDEHMRRHAMTTPHSDAPYRIILTAYQGGTFAGKVIDTRTGRRVFGTPRLERTEECARAACEAWIVDNTTPPPHDAVLAAYRQAQREAHDLVGDLELYLAGHQECVILDEMTWGHVADITYLIQQLQEVIGKMV